MRFVIPLLFGLAGTAILMSLGVWQLQRLAWKEAVLADIEARIAATPGALPAMPEPDTHRYLPVALEGDPSGDPIHVLVSQKVHGAGYRVIQPIQMGDRRILADLGVIPLDAKDAALPVGPYRITGNLHWPDEVDSFTPEPDADRGIWFARDVPAMARARQTEPTLVIARSVTPEVATPLPVSTAGIPNNHLGYAIQWFGLAIVWLGMTAFFLWRMRRRTE